MSDGPHRSLNMHRSWKRLAEYADNQAYSVDEVARAFLPALAQTCSDEVPDQLWRDITRIFGDQQRALFREQKVDEIAALRTSVAGRPLACAIVDAAVKGAAQGNLGPESLVNVVTEALLNRAGRGNRQVEEHFYRKSTEARSKNVRDRMERALSTSVLDTLARQCLNMSVATKATRSRKQSDLDDGVGLHE